LSCKTKVRINSAICITLLMTARETPANEWQAQQSQG